MSKRPTPPPVDLSTPEARKKAWSDYLWKDHGVLRLRFHNFHQVSDRMWRANQPSPDRIAWLAEQGFKTILNVRGTQPHAAYYALEKEACERHGLAMIDMPFGSREAPYVDRMERAQEIFRTIEYPAMLHCKSGADRAGLMSVFYLMVHEGRPYEEAIEHLSLKYLHVKAGKTGMLDHFFEAYRLYAESTPIRFMDWVRQVYDREQVQSDFLASWWGSLLTEKILRRE